MNHAEKSKTIGHRDNGKDPFDILSPTSVYQKYAKFYEELDNKDISVTEIFRVTKDKNQRSKSSKPRRDIDNNLKLVLPPTIPEVLSTDTSAIQT